jgi:hypothetical protein
MIQHLRVMRYVIAFCVLAVVAAAFLAGCSGSSGTEQTTAGPGTTVGNTTSSDGSTTTSPPVTLASYEKDLATTAKLVNQLAKFLDEQSVSENDPRLGLLYGLRTRVQALSCRKALEKDDTASADSAMREVHYTLNLGKAVATGTVAQTLAEAYDTAQTVGAPSDSPDEATQVLITLISQLEPLMTEAQTMLAGTTTTAG